MNQDQVKERLLQLDSEVSEFALIFSGKESKKVDGLYHPELMEIIIHNKNFVDDNSLMYTAMHEFAHHIQFTKHDVSVKKRAHSTLFWDIFHKLLKTAEEKGLYSNIFDTDERFRNITSEIKEKYLRKNGELMKNFGKLLITALDLCQSEHAIFEDYVDRALGMGRAEAKSIMKVYAMDVAPEIGYENMKIVSKVKDPGKRSEVESNIKNGMSQAEVKEGIKSYTGSKDEGYKSISRLENQKRRIERSIEELQLKLSDIDKEIEDRSLSL